MKKKSPMSNVICQGFVVFLLLLTLDFGLRTPSCLYASGMTVTATRVLDSANTSRSSFSSSEKITFYSSVNNTVAEGSNIKFEFYVTDPSGRTVFTHTGNSIPGSVGEGSASIGNIPITQFYSTPGNYILTVKVVGGSSGETKTSNLTFSVTSPQITLTYPSNGARDLTENPVTFRWVASGATKYKIYVDDDAAFFNTIFSAETYDTSYTYPFSLSDERQKLQGGIIYYWKVEGLNSDGSVTATTPVPFSFTLQASAVAPTAKDISITDIQIDKSYTSGLKIDVYVKNQGGKSESSVAVNLYMNGSPVSPSGRVDFISAGETKSVSFYPQVPQSADVVFTASTDFYDDYNKNNLITKFITIPQELRGGPVFVEVEVEVVDSDDNKKVSEAELKFNPEDGGPPLEGTTIDGSFKTKLAVGNYSIDIKHADYDDLLKQQIAVSKDKATKFSWKLKKKKKDKGKILGSVVRKDNGKKIENATVEYKGVKSDSVKTNKGGEYKIEGLALGEYELKATKEGYKDSDVKKVELTKAIPETNVDFELEEVKKKEISDKKEKKSSVDIVKELLKDIMAGLDSSITSKLENYELTEVEAGSGVDVGEIMGLLKDKKAKISGAELK